MRLRGEAALDLGPALGGGARVVVLAAGLAGPRPAGAHLVPLDGSALAGLRVQLAERLEAEGYDRYVNAAVGSEVKA